MTIPMGIRKGGYKSIPLVMIIRIDLFSVEPDKHLKVEYIYFLSNVYTDRATRRTRKRIRFYPC